MRCSLSGVRLHARLLGLSTPGRGRKAMKRSVRAVQSLESLEFGGELRALGADVILESTLRVAIELKIELVIRPDRLQGVVVQRVPASPIRVHVVADVKRSSPPEASLHQQQGTIEFLGHADNSEVFSQV